MHIASGLTIVGTVFLAAAIIGSVGLVTSLVFGTSPAALAAGLASGVLVAMWYAGPLAIRLRTRGRPDE